MGFIEKYLKWKNDGGERVHLITPRTIPVAFLPSPHYKAGRIVPIDLVVIHATESRLSSAVDWLRNPTRKSPLSSCHYIIAENGAIIQIVDEANTAYHAIGEWDGRKNINSRSIGIEIENKNDGEDEYTEAQLASCLAIHINLCCRKKTLIHAVGHGDVDKRIDEVTKKPRRTDPGPLFPWARYRASAATAWEYRRKIL